jgi:hypothetical protein
MALGRKTGGRQKGARNRATEEARAAAEATGVTPLTYMLGVMRDPTADNRRRDAMAMAAAPYLHPKMSTVEATSTSSCREREPEPVTIQVNFVRPPPRHADEDQDGDCDLPLDCHANSHRT